MHGALANGVGSLLEGLPPLLVEQAAEILAASAIIEIEPGEPTLSDLVPDGGSTRRR
jgi:hypothetical protein